MKSTDRLKELQNCRVIFESGVR